MGEQVSEAEGTRIMNHMNQDHSSSLTHYLSHFASIKNPVSPKITCFKTPSMTIQHGPSHARQDWEMKFNPPMLAGAARHRLADIHHEARKGLGLSEVVVNSFEFNFGNSLAMIISGGLQLLLIFGVRSEKLSSYSPRLAGIIAEVLVNYFGFINVTATSVGNVEKGLFLGTLALIHLFEAVTMLPALFYKYNTTSPLVKLQYFVATIIAGFHIWRSFRTQGEEEEHQLLTKADDKKQKH